MSNEWWVIFVVFAIGIYMIVERLDRLGKVLDAMLAELREIRKNGP